MVTLDLSDGEFGEKIALARGCAIQEYTGVEFALCALLSHLLGTTSDYAAIVFYRIINSSARTRILDDLYQKRHGDKFASHWKSLLKTLRTLDQRRNEIVHWHKISAVTVTDDGSVPTGAWLSPPAFWASDGDHPEIGLTDLAEFVSQCNVVHRSMGMLTSFLSGHLPDEAETKWQPIFEQPFVYPLPDDHPFKS